MVPPSQEHDIIDEVLGRARPHAFADGRSHPHRLLALLVCAVLSMAGALLVQPETAVADVNRAFTPVFSTQTNGEIAVTGNTLLTCDVQVAAECRGALAGTANKGNNDFLMRALDADSDASTQSSSGATVRIPDGSKVLYAGLFWGAATVAGSQGVSTQADITKIRLRTPDATAYQTITASRTPDRQANQGSRDYSAYADVTALVQSSGSGRYFGADIAAATGYDRYAGWSIVVAYSNPALPLRDLNVFTGYGYANVSPVTTTIAGFLTPAAGTVNARFGAVVYEGDQQLSGDYFSVGKTRLADDASLSSNFFASRATTGGSNLTDRTPANLNTLGLDAKVVDAPNVLANGSRSASVTFGSEGDVYYPAALTTQVDLYAPNVRGTTSVVNLSNHDPAQVGDTLEYTLALANTGQDPATGTVLTTPLPAGTTYVPGTLAVTSGAGAGSKTDAVDGDQAEIRGGALRVRLGTGAGASAGGTLNPADTTSVRLRTLVQPSAAGTTLTTLGGVDYTAKTLAKTYAYQTNEVATPVSTLADLSLVKTGPASIVVGQDVTWQLALANAGPSTATGVTVTDTLPDGFAYGSATGAACSAAGRTLSCAVSDLAPGEKRLVSVVGSTDADSDASSLGNSATVTSSTSDPDPTNNTSSASASQSRAADLGLSSTSSPASVRPGEKADWILRTRNAGPSRARAVTVSDTLPAGLTVEGVSSSAGTCDVAGSSVLCAIGSLAPGAEAKVVVTGRLDPAYEGGAASLADAAFTQTSTFDPVTDDNAASSVVGIDPPRADLVLLPRPLSDEVVAGRPAAWQFSVVNQGPSRAVRSEVEVALPEGLENVVLTASTGSCVVDGLRAFCKLGDLGPGAASDVVVGADVLSTTQGAVTLGATARSATEDPDLANNTRSLKEPVIERADLSLTKTATPSPAQIGGKVTYTLTVHNDGPSIARGITLADEVPEPLEPTGASTGNGDGACVLEGRDVSCSLVPLKPGQDVVVQVGGLLPDVDVDLGTIVNRASVTSSADDPDPEDNTASTRLGTERSADVTIAATGPDRLTAGTRGTWELLVSDAGPSNAGGVLVTADLPPGLEDVDLSTPEGVDCAVDGGRLRCTIGKLSPTDPRTIRFTGRLGTGTPAGPLSSVASVSAESPDPTTSNNTATATTTVRTEAAVSVRATAPSAVTAGDPITVTVDTRNDGPSRAVEPVLIAQLPGSVVDLVLPGGCTVSGLTVTCRPGDLDPGDARTYALAGRVQGDTPDRTVLDARATVSTSTPDPDDGDDAASTTTTVDGSAELRLTAVADPSPMVAGGRATYRIEVANDGPSTAAGTTVTDEVPAGLTVVGAQSAGPCTVDGQQVTCEVGAIAAGATTQVQVAVLVGGDVVGPVVSTAVAASTTNDRSPADNTASVSTPVVRSADLALTTAADPTTVAAGQAVTYTLGVVSAGPSRATGVTITDRLPAGTEVIDADGCTVTGRDLSCAVGDLDSGADAAVRVTVRFPEDAPAGSVTSEAQVTSQDPDPDGANNRSAATVEVVQRASLSVDKTVFPGSLIPGNEATYTLLVGNTGPSVARDVTVRDAVPAPLSVVSATTASGTSCDVEGRTVSCDLGALGLAQRVVRVVTTMPAGYVGEALTNTARVSSSTQDDQADDDEVSITTPVVPKADLALTETLSPTAPVPGGEVTFTLRSTNRGPSAAQDVAIADLLPYALVDVRPEASDGGRCTVAPRPADPELGPNGGQLSCSFADVAVGASVSVVLRAKVRPDALGTLVDTATTGSPTLDPETADNTASASGGLVPSADVSVTKRLVGAAVPGTDVTWELVLSDAGPSTARSVVLTDAVPDVVSGVTARADDGDACSVTDRTVTCERDRVEPGSPVTVTVVGRLDAGATGTLTNTATVRTATPDPGPADDTATVGSSVAAVADLRVVKTMSPASPVPGEDVTFAITALNRGPSTATGVVVEDVLPAALTDLELRPSAGGTCRVAPKVGSAGELSCTWASVAVGDTVGVDLTATVDPGATGALSNTATARSDATDPERADDTSTAAGTLAPSADVSVVKRLVGTATVGEPVTWQLDVADAGPSTARSVRLTDLVPASVSDVRVSTADADACAVHDGKVECAWDRLEVGEPVSVTVTGVLGPDAGATLTNAATVSAQTADPVAANDASEVVSDVGAVADLSVDVVRGAGDAVPGGTVAYTLTTTDRGPSAATGVVTEDELPASLVDAQVDGPDAAACTVAPRDGTGGVVRCTWDRLDAGAVVEVGVRATVRPDATGTLTNTVRTTARTPDPVPADNEDDDAVDLVPSADLSVTSRLDGGATAGAPVTWRLVVRNDGPSTARAVRLDELVPATVTGVTVVADEAARAPGGACAVTGGAVVCRWDALDPQSSRTVTVSGVLHAGASGTLTDAASVSSGTPDPRSANNAASAAAEVAVVSDVSVSKRVVGDVVAGAVVTWTITVDDLGPSTARGVVLRDEVPAGVQQVTAESGGEACRVTGSSVLCSWDSVLVGEPRTVTVTGLLDVGSTGTLTNTASVTSSSTDPTDGNGTSAASAEVREQAPTSPPTSPASSPPSGTSSGPGSTPGGGLASTGSEVGPGALLGVAALLVAGALLTVAGARSGRGERRSRR